MKPEAQIIAIAEATFFKRIGTREEWKDTRNPNACVAYTFRDDGFPLPDYLTDLNAMHEAIDWLRNYNGSGYFIYQVELKRIAGGNYWPDATAAQRAEAFLRTLNLWTD